VDGACLLSAQRARQYEQQKLYDQLDKAANRFRDCHEERANGSFNPYARFHGLF
jgi:hypothetical protein